MKIDSKELKKLGDNIKKTKGLIPKVIEESIVKEGRIFVDNAVKIVDRERIYASKLYQRSFFTDSKANITANKAEINMGNSVNYAGYIEKGFKSHFVPGYWHGRVFVYDNNCSKGMYVGKGKKAVKGRYVTKRALQETEKVQSVRIKREIENFLKKNITEGL